MPSLRVELSETGQAWEFKTAELEDSSGAVRAGDWRAVRERMASHGYLFIRGLLPAEDVAAAEVACRCFLHRMGMCSEDGVGVDGKEGMLLSGLEEITHDEAVSTALAGDSLTAFFAGLFGEDALALETRWLRCKARGEGSAAHSDAFFFPSTEQVTCWVPLGDCPLQRGPLAVCEASHTIDGYDKRTEDELPSGFAAVAESTVWRTAAFAKGDVLVFHARTLHASLINESETFRISSDTRWFPASAKERVVNDPSRVAESK